MKRPDLRLTERQSDPRALKIDSTVAIELEYSPDPSKIVEWVEEAYTQTDRLMQLTGLRG